MNLTLQPVYKIHKLKLLEGKAELGRYLNLKLPESWPTFPEAFQISQQDSNSDDGIETADIFGGYFFIDFETKTLVGNGGFTGPPDAGNSVEIGYEIATEFWNRGYATLAAERLIALAFGEANVFQVKATTLAEENASNRVLKKCGMTFLSEEPNDEFGKVWVFGINRQQFEKRND
ncbi:N-acetyltransferase [Leptospira gomenensis]|uniref:N-acetyltransferase n=1 Tax=Leptospira gomenensis TaxID=2484974 RepID=A0A5F1YEJ1_9LEPT|nr:GNAT family protein [Leptospira gomenensis]TGK37556.1 N-acetyltransferase [Leptospira gomenensis]TGK39438.1 N-acetyltransferase [Leptospira gomenensis]TGK43140.1 N-acetyltransferase [Leptospira gomenensis]TGK55031.1 N-acetyltransferase [Leptospira gomenensis]